MGLTSGDSGMGVDNKSDDLRVGTKRPLIVPDGDDIAASPILPPGPPIMRRRLDFE